MGAPNPSVAPVPFGPKNMVYTTKPAVCMGFPRVIPQMLVHCLSRPGGFWRCWGGAGSLNRTKTMFSLR